MPSCRFWYFHIKCINRKLTRRCGKPLVLTPYIEDTDDRNQEYPCQVPQTQPFRSTSNDVSRATGRCNVDSVPVLQTTTASGGDHAAPRRCSSSCPTRPKKRRLTSKMPDPQKATALVRKADAYATWFHSLATLSTAERACINGFAASFQKTAGVDFYITKYQGKPMETLTRSS